ncbi:MAG: hypothetical protein KatS3mg103_0489 [Phycisphaerales bacterium]|nr:MAG: hypothetical protein KatS3mg103_0489 [Phycisphaerales bacterium]
MTLAARFGQGTWVALLTKGAVRLARGVDLQHVDGLVLDGQLHVHQAADAQGAGQLLAGRADLLEDAFGQFVGRQEAGAVAAVHAGVLDVLHDAADDGLSGLVGVVGVVVGDDVHVDLGGAVEELVDEDGRVGQAAFQAGAADGAVDEPAQGLDVLADLHASSAEHVAGPDEDGVADLGGDGLGLLSGACDAAGRAGQVQLFQELVEAIAVLGQVDGGQAGPDDGRVGHCQAVGEVEWCLSAELDDGAQELAVGAQGFGDVEHVLEGERLEEEAGRWVS